jgi:hypothetical protein
MKTAIMNIKNTDNAFELEFAWARRASGDWRRQAYNSTYPHSRVRVRAGSLDLAERKTPLVLPFRVILAFRLCMQRILGITC